MRETGILYGQLQCSENNAMKGTQMGVGITAGAL